MHAAALLVQSLDELDQRGWWTPIPDDDSAWALPDHLRAADPLNGCDFKWVNQMPPFVRHFSLPGEQMFDPFCGFGSALLAAAVESRNAHGIESIPRVHRWQARACSDMAWRRRW